MTDHEIVELHGPVFLGEGPYYQESIQALMYVDAFKGDIHRHFINTGRHQVVHVGMYFFNIIIKYFY